MLRLVEKKKKTSSPRPNSFISSRLFLFSVLSACSSRGFAEAPQSRVIIIEVRRLFWKYMWTDFLVRNSFEKFWKILRQNEGSFAVVCLNHNKFSRIFPTYFWMTKLNLIFVKKIHKFVFFADNKKIVKSKGVLHCLNRMSTDFHDFFLVFYVIWKKFVKLKWDLHCLARM